MACTYRNEELPDWVDVPVAVEQDGREQWGLIEFEGLFNTRDLGGLRAADGRQVKRGVLLRSGALGFGSDADLARLRDEYNLQLVVDLRNDTGMSELPDPLEQLGAPRFVQASIFTERVFGITQEKAEQEMLRLKQEAGETGRESLTFMKLLYPRMLLEETGIAGYRAFFRALLACDEGAALWHCHVGRDRCGMASVLLEVALGVSMEDIENDYLATNLYAPLDITLYSPAALSSLESACAAAEEHYGSLMGYITHALGVTPAQVNVLRERYLV